MVIDNVVKAMSLDEKIGQMFTLGFLGSVVTPEVRESIISLHAGGLRITPNAVVNFKRYKKVLDIDADGNKRDPGPVPTPHMLPEELQRTLNDLQELAVSRPHGIPLHISADVEGGVSADISRGYPLFPSSMGLACQDDPDLFYRVAKAVARSLRTTGVNMIHSPVLDVVDHPFSPEINIRSYADDPQKVALYAGEALRAFSEEGVIATGKHFPGRGYSRKDVHYEEDICSVLLEDMLDGELLPYTQLIAAGLPAVMLAHSIYPGLGSDLPVTISGEIAQKLLKERMGFKGVVTTDAITMEGILSICPVEEACARAIQAGCDLVLYKTTDVKAARLAMETVKSWVMDGRIPEERIDDGVRRILAMKADAGLFDEGWRTVPEELRAHLDDPEVRNLSRRAAQVATLGMRDRKNILPVSGGSKILVVEQAMFLCRYTYDSDFHPYMLWEYLDNIYPGAGLVRLDMFGTDEDLAEVRETASGYDLIVATNIYSRGARPNTDFLKQVIARTDKDVIVVTNSPFPATVTGEMDTVVCIFSEMPESLRAGAEVIAGRLPAGNRLPIGCIEPYIR
ncbi:MAG: glycoside hydrolase family 3 N-terminal domain-containing protein [bacterium]|nr:glycoside hydrolase family 3 N-terminal domain-containing protein [bacterium]